MAEELLTWRIGSRSVEFIEPTGAEGRPDVLTGWCTQMEMLIGGTWQPAASGRAEEVTSAFDGAIIGMVPVAGADDVGAALELTALALARCFTDAGLPDGVLSVRTGDPRSEETTMGTLITAAESERVERSIRQAVTEGAKLLTGGERDGAIVSPAVVAGVDPQSAFSQDELFGPAVAVSSADDWESAIAQANGTLWLGRRHLHLRRGRRGAGHPGDRRRHRAHQLDPAVAG